MTSPNQRVAKIKQHVKDNKTTYIAVGVTAVVAVAATLAASATLGNGASTAQVSQRIGLAFRAENRAVVINIVERSTPSKPVHLVGTDLYFDSLHDAARKTGHSLSKISRNINGHITDINGDVFELLQPA